MATPYRDPVWIKRSVRLREIAAELAGMAVDFNLERESCSCGESQRWRDMTQRQLSERMAGLVERTTQLADTIERRVHEFVPRTVT